MENFVSSTHQAAGHVGALVHQDGSVFAKLTTQQEIDFYNAIQLTNYKNSVSADNDDDEPGSRLKDWMPVFVGTLSPGMSEKVTEELRNEQKENKHPSAEYAADNNSDATLVAGIERLGIAESPPFCSTEVSKNIKESSEAKQYIVLQNLYHGFKNPSILDIKLGSVLYDSSAPNEKKERLKKVSKATTSSSLGFRICGMRLFHDEVPSDFPNSSFEMQNVVFKHTNGYLSFDKFFGRSLKEENVKDALKLFFTHNRLSKKRQRILIENCLVRLQLLYNCLLSEEVRIISGSLLFIYENEPTVWDYCRDYDPILREDFFSDEDDDEDDESNESNDNDDDKRDRSIPLSSLHMIDFAHSTIANGKGYDENIINGIDNLLKVVEML